ncbi:MAG: sulfotransferase [Hyphomicrobiales bacterium]
MQRFVMFAMPRTGSSWLRTILDSHPDITCYAALFRNRPWKKNEFNRLLEAPDPRFYEVDYRMANFEAALEAVFGSTPPIQHVGLKHMSGAQPKIRNYLASNPQFRKVVLRRDNLLAVYASNLLAKATGQGSVRRDVEMKISPIRFDRKEFAAFSKRYERAYEDVRAVCAGELIEIEYNALRQGDDMRRLGEFFEVDTEQMTFDTTRKRGNDSIVDRFENPEDALSYLKDFDREQWAVER